MSDRNPKPDPQGPRLICDLPEPLLNALTKRAQRMGMKRNALVLLAA